MLGRLLEFSFPTADIGAAVKFYRAIGFADTETRDVFDVPYQAMSNTTIAVGLYASPDMSAGPTFVRPNLDAWLKALRRLHVEPDFAELSDETFNRAGFHDPNLLPVRLLEARTFSPLPDTDDPVSAVGRFLELSVATHSLSDSASFWQSLGLETIEEGSDPTHWLRLTGHGLTIGFHEGMRFAPGLSFEARGLDARMAFLDAKGLDLTDPVPFARLDQDSVTVRAPDGHPVFMLDAASEGDD
jgi:catechol 2,3-dioxygenase-like lactoylglutathione lyase family enzyme